MGMRLLFSFLLFFATSFTLKAQSVSLRAAHNFMPARHFSLRYEHWTNGTLNLAVGGFMERSFVHGLNYSSFGIDALLESNFNPEGYEAGKFGLKSAVGLNWLAVQEPWVYKDLPLSKRSAFGLTGELTGMWFMTETFSLRANIQQKFLFSNSLGRSRILMGSGLGYQF